MAAQPAPAIMASMIDQKRNGVPDFVAVIDRPKKYRDKDADPAVMMPKRTMSPTRSIVRRIFTSV
jgi:hypothetical protein